MSLEVKTLIRRVNRLESTLNGGATNVEKKDNTFEVVLKNADGIECSFKGKPADVFVTELDDNNETFKRIINSDTDLSMRTKVTIDDGLGNKRYAYIQSPIISYLNEVNDKIIAESSVLFTVANLAEAGNGGYQSTFNYGGSLKGLKDYNERAKKFIENAVNIVRADNNHAETKTLGDLCAKLYARQPSADMIEAMAGVLYIYYGAGLMEEYTGIQKMCRWMPHNSYIITNNHGVQWNRYAAITEGEYEILDATCSLLIKSGDMQMYQPLLNSVIKVKLPTEEADIDAEYTRIVTIATNSLDSDPDPVITLKCGKEGGPTLFISQEGPPIDSIISIEITGGRIRATSKTITLQVPKLSAPGGGGSGSFDGDMLTLSSIAFNAFQAISPDARRQFSEMYNALTAKLALCAGDTVEESKVLSGHFLPIFTNYLTGVRDWQTIVNWEQNVLELATIQAHEITKMKDNDRDKIIETIGVSMGDQVTLLKTGTETAHTEEVGKAQFYFIRAANNMQSNLMLAKDEKDIDYEIHLVFNDRTEVCDGNGEHIPPEGFEE